jgi:RNA polymerase sigma factor (sigma-70 family)
VETDRAGEFQTRKLGDGQWESPISVRLNGEIREELVKGDLAVARGESVLNNHARDFRPARLGAVSALLAPLRRQSPAPLDMPINGPGQRVRHVLTRGSGGDGTAAISGDTHDYETMFVSNLAVVESVIKYACQRHRLSGSEAEEFDSEVKVRLVDRDYEVFRKFQHRSSLRTYLTIVIQRIYLDYRNHLWGKWRPSAEAQRLGPLAVRLETLMVRDGFGFDQACEHLRTNEHMVALDSDLNAIVARLPVRAKRAMMGEDELEDVADPADPVGDHLLSNERRAGARRILVALRGAVRTLSDQDRLILRLRFQDGIAVADIARALHIDQKPLYRRFDGLLRQLRAALEAAGVDSLEACELLNRNDVDISLALLGATPGADAPGTRPTDA